MIRQLFVMILFLFSARRVQLPCSLAVRSLLVLLSVFHVGCARYSARPGSFSGLLHAEERGLEVDQTVDDQARQAVLETPTTFALSFEEERSAWERARFFFEQYLAGSPSDGRSGVVVKVVGSRWILTNAVVTSYQYEVSKEHGAGIVHFAVRCMARDAAKQHLAQLNAANLARFIRSGTLERSLIAQ